jgi:cytoplasmic iron level regulating protein YaaA (DUF328/UPF0246 family)
MNIIYSPAKTMQFEQRMATDVEPFSYYQPILNELHKYSAKKLANVYSCSLDIATSVYESIQGFEKARDNAALCAFTGLAYQSVRPFEYTDSEWDYAQKTIRILDAFYGVLTPKTMIKPYRLDFKSKLKQNITKRWNFTFEEPIINLASKEFSSLVKQPMISIDFLERSNGKNINKATYSKMARGTMLDYCITHQITKPKDLKKFNLLGYQFDAKSSTDSNYVFVREKSL